MYLYTSHMNACTIKRHELDFKKQVYDVFALKEERVTICCILNIFRKFFDVVT